MTEQSFFPRIKQIAALVRQGPTSSGFERDIKPLLSHISALAVFFERVSGTGDIRWLAILHNAGLFNDLPPMNKEAILSRGVPPWAQSKYLAKVAGEAPKYVRDIILSIPYTENPVIHMDYLQAALAMPAEISVTLIPKAKEWLKSSYEIHFPERYADLGLAVAKANYPDEGFDLLKSLLYIRREDPKKSEGYMTPPKVRGRFERFIYEQILEKYIPEFSELDGVRTLVLLCDLLSDALDLSHSDGEEDSPKNVWSSLWCPDIEDDSRTGRGIPEILVTVIRKAAGELAPVLGKKVLEIIESHAGNIFFRMGLVLRRIHHELDPEGTEEILLRRDLLDDTDTQYEYRQLLASSFGSFSATTQERYLQMVSDGPEKDRSGEDISTESPEEMEKENKAWKWRRLSLLERFLNQEWKKTLAELAKDLGFQGSYHPTPNIGRVIVEWVDKSPKTIEEVLAMPVEDLVVFIRGWKPDNPPFGPTMEGLAGQLVGAVARRPDQYFEKLDLFVEFGPTFVSKVVSGFDAALESDGTRAFRWEPVLKSCLSILPAGTEHSGGDKEKHNHRDWSDVRRSIAELLKTGLAAPTSGIPFEHRNLCWQILESLTQDPDPTLEDEEHRILNRDPVTLSINTVRGIAMHAVIRYALWVRKHKMKKDEGSSESAPTLDEMPEVRSVIDYHLDPKQDPCLSIRSVYGQWFPLLALIDLDWTRQNAPRIFPCEESLAPLRDAAWIAYMGRCGPYDQVWEIIHGEYRRAVGMIGKFPEYQLLPKPDERLIEHLVAFYAREKLTLHGKDSLIEEFYSKASPELRAHAISHIGHSLCNQKEPVPDDIRDRLMQIWHWRLDLAKKAQDGASAFEGEIKAFGYWFNSQKFDDKWSIEQLRDALRLIPKTDWSEQVVERLAELADSMSAEVVECFSLMVDGDPDYWTLSSWTGSIKEALQKALVSDQAGTRQAAEDLLNRLGEMGFYKTFEDIVPEKWKSRIDEQQV